MVNFVNDGYSCFLNDYGCAQHIGKTDLIKQGQLKKGLAGFTPGYAGNIVYSFCEIVILKYFSLKKHLK